MPTLVGARRRGFTPEGFRLFADRIGVSKSDSWIDMSVLEQCMRDDLNGRAERRIAVLRPLKLIIDNFPDGHEEICHAPNHPQEPELGQREMPLTRELWIETEDFVESPPKGYFRLHPGNMVRLRYGFVVKCIGADKDAAGNIAAVHCKYLPDSKSGTPGANSYKVKGNIHWLSAKHACQREVRLYDRLFRLPNPGKRQQEHAAAGHAPDHHSTETDDSGKLHQHDEKIEHDWLADLNPQAKQTITAQLEPALRNAQPEDRFQFERIGYFCVDLDSAAIVTASECPASANSSWPANSTATAPMNTGLLRAGRSACIIAGHISSTDATRTGR